MEDYERTIMACSTSNIEEKIALLDKKVSEGVVRAERMKENARDVFLSDKHEQLDSVLGKYGKVDCRTISIEQIALMFVRLQGEEAIVRNDIKTLGDRDAEKASEKKLAIARRILAEKRNNGGRRT